LINSDAIKACYEAGFTVIEVALAFNVPTVVVCQCVDYPVAITKELWSEITSEHPDKTAKEVARMYNTYDQAIYNAAKRKFATGNTKRTKDMIMSQLIKHGSIEEAADALDITTKTASKRLGMKPQKQSYPSLKDLLAFEGTQQEAAEFFDVSQATISKKLKGKHLLKSKSTPNKIKDWDAVLKYLRTHSMRETARNFGVSAACISQWLKRNKITV
jgi:hypothetical protein